MSTTLINDLKNVFKGDIKYDDATLEHYSRDASLFKIRPEVVVFPRSAAELKSIIEFVNSERAKGKEYYITPRSGGTDMSGGPLGTSIVLDFTKYFNSIREVTESYAITQPGVYYRDFDKETLKHKAIMPAYTASREICTVGGMVANNSGGEKTLLYGKTTDYIEDLKVVFRDGNEYDIKPLTLSELEGKKKLQTLEGQIYRDISNLVERNYDKIMAAKPHVSKNSAGYYLWDILDKEKGTFNLAKLITGSQGTLGLVTEIKFRLIKPKEHTRLLVIFMEDMKNLGELTNHILAFKPESLESYDDHTFRLAVKFFPAMIKTLKGSIFKLAFKFIPEFWAILTGGIPKLVLLAEFTADTDEEALDKALKAQASLAEFKVKSKVTTSADEVKKYWTIRRESFNILRHHVKHLRTAPFIDDFVVNPEYLPEFLPKLYETLDMYNITYTIAGHVGNGNFHIIPLMDMHDQKSKEIINQLMKKVNTLVLEYKGSITGEHNDGIIRTPYIQAMFGSDMYKLFMETKKIFDPDNIFNPGKKVGGTWEYATQHFDTDLV